MIKSSSELHVNDSGKKPYHVLDKCTVIILHVNVLTIIYFYIVENRLQYHRKKKTFRLVASLDIPGYASHTHTFCHLLRTNYNYSSYV